MAATIIVTIGSPALNTEYVAPDGAWVIPANATSISLHWAALKADGSGAAVVNVTLINRDVTSGVDSSTLALNGINAGDFTSSTGHNGADVFTAAFKITSAPGGLPDHCTLQLTAYTGTPYGQEFIRRAGVWTPVDGSINLIRRAGAWAAIPDEQIRRSNVWTPS